MRPLVVSLASLVIIAAMLVPAPASASLANAECWAYYVEVFDADGELADAFFGSYCWTSNPYVLYWQLTPGSEQQHAALAAAYEAGAPGIEHHDSEHPIEGGGHYTLDGYRIYEDVEGPALPLDAAIV